jgi:hypothetical protein
LVTSETTVMNFSGVATRHLGGAKRSFEECVPKLQFGNEGLGGLGIEAYNSYETSGRISGST